MNLSQLADRIMSLCEVHGIVYDPKLLPVKLTADCYIFHATPLTPECKLHGSCRLIPYYALTGGETIQIMKQ